MRSWTEILESLGSPPSEAGKAASTIMRDLDSKQLPVSPDPNEIPVWDLAEADEDEN